MIGTRCGNEHPDDMPPIQRRCNREPAHDGAHRYAGGYHTNWIDEWPNEQETSR